jgi:threonine aldolase
MNKGKLNFSCDYLEGAHPRILKRLMETNLEKMPGYGFDPLSLSAKDRIRKACGCPDAEVQLLSGGTQTNEVMTSCLIGPWQGVVAATSGHVNVHEAGAIEAGGHKVIALPGSSGKLSGDQIRKFMSQFRSDGNWEHMVEPGMAYISQPTEYGTIYSLSELEDLSRACHENGVKLYLDGARLAYALASPDNDVALPDIARLCDAFYIGGTKCGALAGEAVVVPDPKLIPHFFTRIKQHGALMAKGRILGAQFDELFRDNLYLEICKKADEQARRIEDKLVSRGIELLFRSPTNQVFFIIGKEQMEKLSENVEFSFWEWRPDGRVVVRLATSWASTDEDVDSLLALF